EQLGGAQRGPDHLPHGQAQMQEGDQQHIDGHPERTWYQRPPPWPARQIPPVFGGRLVHCRHTFPHRSGRPSGGSCSRLRHITLCNTIVAKCARWDGNRYLRRRTCGRSSITAHSRTNSYSVLSTSRRGKTTMRGISWI